MLLFVCLAIICWRPTTSREGSEVHPLRVPVVPLLLSGLSNWCLGVACHRSFLVLNFRYRSFPSSPTPPQIIPNLTAKLSLQVLFNPSGWTACGLIKSPCCPWEGLVFARKSMEVASLDVLGAGFAGSATSFQLKGHWLGTAVSELVAFPTAFKMRN